MIRKLIENIAIIMSTVLCMTSMGGCGLKSNAVQEANTQFQSESGESLSDEEMEESESVFKGQDAAEEKNTPEEPEIPTTTLIDDEHLLAIAENLDYSTGYPKLNMSFQNKSDDAISVFVNMTVNDYVRCYGNQIYRDRIYLDKGESIEEAVDVINYAVNGEESWYPEIQDPNVIHKVDISLSIQSYKTLFEGIMNIDLVEYPEFCYKTDNVEITTDAAEIEDNILSGTEILNQNGLNLQFLKVATKNDEEALIFFADNQSDKNYLIASDNVSVDGTVLNPVAESLQNSNIEGSLLDDAFPDKSLFFASYIPSGKKGYVVMKVPSGAIKSSSSEAAIEFGLVPLEEDLYEYEVLRADGRLEDLKNAITTEFRNVEIIERSFSLTGSSTASVNNAQSSSVGNFFNNSTDYNFNLVENGKNGKATDPDYFLSAVLNDVFEINIDDAKLSEICNEYSYRATDDVFSDNGSASAGDGFARNWYVQIGPAADQSTESFYKFWDEIFEENGYDQYTSGSTKGWSTVHENFYFTATENGDGLYLVINYQK